MGYTVVGLELAQDEALTFQNEAGKEIRCFLRAPATDLPSVDSCGLAEAAKRRRPPSLLTVRLADQVREIDAYLGAHPNRVEAIELSMREVREAYESAPAKTFEWTSRLARVASSRRVPVMVSSAATIPEELSTPLTKRAFTAVLKTSRRSTEIRKKNFLRRLEQVVSTRGRAEGT
jgi:hypothetical protein